MKIDKRNPRHWLLLVQQGVYTLIAIIARKFSPRRERPLVILYGHQLSGNLKALYDQWTQDRPDEFDCYFLSLDPQYAAMLRRDGVRVLRCSHLRDMLLVGRADAIISDHGLHAMKPFVRGSDILFIDVWHGIPFKGFIPEDFRLQQQYDEIWVSSPLLKDIYRRQFGFSADRVFAMGYARADKLFRGESPSNSYRRRASIPDSRKLVLYAPTWQQDHKGHELFPFGESQDSFISVLSRVCSEHSATLVIRSHLNASISEQAYDNVQYCSMKQFPDTEGILQETDVLLCDWSSIAFDFLALNRPAIFLNVPVPYENGLSLGPEYRYGEVVNDMPSLARELTNILLDPQGYHARRGDIHRDITARVYGEHADGQAARRQVQRLVDMIGRRDQ